MTTKETVFRNVTIDYSDCDMGVNKLKGDVALHRHELDGSQTIVVRTLPKESVRKFLRMDANMEDYQKRVVEEKRELDLKITNLEIFVKSENFTKMVPSERVRLAEQCDIMNKYSKILEERINNF